MPDNATKRLETLARICTGKLRREILQPLRQPYHAEDFPSV